MKIAFGVFDWGLGHATRDIPLIEALLKRRHEVHIISTGRALALLKNYFGKKCTFFEVPSLFVPYSRSSFFSLYFAKSSIKLLKSLKKATLISKQIIKREKYNLVISDCRYDFYDEVDNSYFINHQLRFKSFPVLQNALEKWLAWRMSKYKFILVPDFKESNLSGILSHDLKYIDSKKIKYLGILSHYKKKDIKKDVDIFVSISGPEPQRTVLEEILLPMLKKINGKIVVALGKPEAKKFTSNKNLQIYSFLGPEKQEEFMNRAKLVITRSGYTTMMELAELEKKQVLLIPTPGQTEQEYLADYYEQKGYFHHVSQNNLNLEKDLMQLSNFKGIPISWNTKESVKNFMKLIENFEISRKRNH